VFGEKLLVSGLQAGREHRIGVSGLEVTRGCNYRVALDSQRGPGGQFRGGTKHCAPVGDKRFPGKGRRCEPREHPHFGAEVGDDIAGNAIVTLWSEAAADKMIVAAGANVAVDAGFQFQADLAVGLESQALNCQVLAGGADEALEGNGYRSPASRLPGELARQNAVSEVEGSLVAGDLAARHLQALAIDLRDKPPEERQVDHLPVERGVLPKDAGYIRAPPGVPGGELLCGHVCRHAKVRSVLGGIKKVLFQRAARVEIPAALCEETFPCPVGGDGKLRFGEGPCPVGHVALLRQVLPGGMSSVQGFSIR